jgi:hypothetical protein
MTVDEAITALQRAREMMGGEARLCLPDNAELISLVADARHGTVYISDLPNPKLREVVAELASTGNDGEPIIRKTCYVLESLYPE